MYDDEKYSEILKGIENKAEKQLNLISNGSTIITCYFFLFAQHLHKRHKKRTTFNLLNVKWNVLVFHGSN